MFEYIQFISIILEALIAILFVMIAAKGRTYMYGIAVTFAIYVWYDLVRLMEWHISEGVQVGAFFIATLLALYTAWHLYKK